MAAPGAVNFPLCSALRAVPLAVLSVLCAVALQAQSISIANPGSGIPTITGSSNSFTVTYSGAAITKVCYTLDVYPLYNPGIDAPTVLGCSVTAPFSIPYNSYWNGNGPHTLAATAYDALGAVVAASSAVPFNIQNTWPNPNNLTMTVNYGTPTSSPWSGTVSVTPTFTGTGAGTDALSYFLYVNGILQGAVGAFGGQIFTSSTLNAYTQDFQNGPADVCVEVADNTSGSTYTGHFTFIGGAYESCAQVTLANGATATNVAQTNAHDIYLTPGGPYGGTCDVAPIGSGSCTLTAKILNTDGSSTTGAPVFCAGTYQAGSGPPQVECASSSPQNANSIPFTVNSSTGLITANPGGLGTGVVVAMVPNVSGSDLSANSVTATSVSSTSHPFSASETGEAVDITGGSGWTHGMWIISSVNSGGTAAIYCQGNSANLCPSATSASGGSFQVGPTRIDNVFVAPSNTTPCFEANGTVHSSYNASCFVMHSMFNGQGNGGVASAIMADQPYYPGAAADFSASGINTYEVGVISLGITGAETSSGFSAWDSTLQNYITQEEGICAMVSNCHLFLIGGGFFTSNGNMWGSTYGPAASWSTPAFQDAVTRWSAYGNVTAMNYGDEYPWGPNPLQGPISYGSGAGQSWLQSITASGGTCTAAVGPGAGAGGTTGYGINAALSFIIHGSSVSGMNSVAPAVYTLTKTPGSGSVAIAVASGSSVTITMINAGSSYSSTSPPSVALAGGGGTYTSATPTISGGAITGITVTGASGYTSNPTVEIFPNFTFPCAGVANGTYNSTNDPGLVVEPLTAAWIQNASGAYEYTPYDVYAKLWLQATNVSPRFAMGAAPIGVYIDGGSGSFAYWFGNTLNTTQSIGSVTTVSDFSDLYPAVGNTNYLISRLAANDLLSPLNIAQTIRSTYGLGYDPSKPLVTLTDSDDGNYWGRQGLSVPVASCSGHLLTFSAPHGIVNIIPGMTRLSISGATDSGSPQDSCNNKFVVWDAPTPATLDVTLAATDQVAAATAGTLYFQDGSTFTVTSGSYLGINASGQVLGTCASVGWSYGGYICGDTITALYSTAPVRKRGQTFTFNGTATGSGAAYFNSNTFLLEPENIANPYDNPGGDATYLYRQVPVLNATGGTAAILTDNNYVKGPRNPSGEAGNSVNPGWSFGTTIECIFLRCAGERMYGWFTALSGYDGNKLGFTGPSANDTKEFGGGSTSVNNQLFMNQHFENTGMVPTFHAHSIAALYWNRYQKYWFQPRLNAPDYGPYMECASAAGSPGDIMACMNVSDGPQTITFHLSPYLQSGQQIVQQVVNDHSIGADTILSAGTTSATLTLQPFDVASFVFPANFGAELEQPTISLRLADVAGATDIVVRWSYDHYYLDVAGDIYDCGTGTCTPGWDRNIGAIYYRLLYRNSSGQVIATSDVQQQ